MAATYQVLLDLDGDGVYEEDITSYCQRASFERGKDEELNDAMSGICELLLVNTDNRFSPEKSSSPYYGDLKTRRGVLLKATSPNAVNLFTGFLSDLNDSPQHRKRTTEFYCVDGMETLARTDIRTPLYKDYLDGDLIVELLGLAGWSEGAAWILDTSELGSETILGFMATNLDDGQDTIPYAYFHKVKALDAINEIKNSSLGFFYVNGSGEAVYEDRHHRLLSPHDTVQATFNDTMADIKPYHRDKDIINEAIATFIPRTIAGGLTDAWTLQGTPLIPVGESITIEADFSYAYDDMENPASTTDYTANSASGGGGTDLTGDITITPTIWAKGARFVITNGASQPAYITLLKIRGKLITEEDNIVRTAYDNDSQREYQKRSLNLNGDFLISSPVAQDFADYVVGGCKDPKARYQIILHSKGDTTGTILGNILTLNISDRIRVVSARLGLDDEFFINKMRHEIDNFGKEHRVTYDIVKAEDEEYWVMDFSELGTNTMLAY